MKKDLLDFIVFIFYLYEPRLSQASLWLCPAAAVACIWTLVVHTVCFFIHQHLLGICSVSCAKLHIGNSKLNEIQSLASGVLLCLSRERYSSQQWNIVWYVQWEKCVKRTIRGTSMFCFSYIKGYDLTGGFLYKKIQKARKEEICSEHLT